MHQVSCLDNVRKGLCYVIDISVSLTAGSSNRLNIARVDKVANLRALLILLWYMFTRRASARFYDGCHDRVSSPMDVEPLHASVYNDVHNNSQSHPYCRIELKQKKTFALFCEKYRHRTDLFGHTFTVELYYSPTYIYPS